METITIKIDHRTKAGKAFKAMLEAVYSKQPGIEVVEDESPYNPEFVKMIKKSAASKNDMLLIQMMYGEV